MKKNTLKLFQILVITAGLLSCTGSNLYKDLASKNTDEALFEDAQTLIDNGQYTAAIAKILSTSAGFQAQTRTKESLAGAYAARCGMEFIPFVRNIANNTADSFFKVALNGFVGVDTSNFADCVVAKNLITGLGDSLQRTSSQNLFLVVLATAMMGNRLRANADKLPTATGDGTVDAAFNCGPTQMPIADAAHVVESFALILENLTALGTVAGGLKDDLTLLKDQCGAACTTITYAGATPVESDGAIIAARGLINMQGVGLGSCNDPNPLNCACLFP